MELITTAAKQIIPARLNVRAAAERLGFPPHDIPILVRSGLLKPLGNPPPNAPKYFARCVVEALAIDVQWLDKATRIVSKHWHDRNYRNKPH